MRRRLMPGVVGAAVVLALVSCGGGGSNFVAPPPPPPPAVLTITNTTLPQVIEGQAYSTTLQASGGTGARTWTAIDPLPAGLTLSSTGTLSGTPSVPASYFFRVQVQDSSSIPQTATAAESLTVLATLSLSNISFPNGNRGIPYQFTFWPAGGIAPFSFNLTAGSLPPGMTVSSYAGSGGQISGTPGQAGTFTFTLQVSDSGSGTLHQTASAQMTMTIDAKLQITSTSLPSGVQGRLYTGSLAAVNGTLPLHWTVPFVPQGLSFNSTTGTFSGTPTQAVASNFAVSVTDSSSPQQSNSASITWFIYGPLQFSQTNLGSIQVGYFGGLFPISFTGGWPPVTSTLISGTLPPGMDLNSSANLLQGLASKVGNYSIVVQLQDSASPPQTAQATLTFTITPLLPVLANSKLPAGVVGKAYSWGVAARDGQPPFAWNVRAGSLPPGLVLDSLGLIHGTPTTAGTYTFTLQVSDSFTPPDTTWSDVSITIHATPLGRNDSIATATPLTNGNYAASISPYFDPTTSRPDTDYYKLTAKPGATVDVTILAARLVPPSRLDSVIEILDGSGARFTACRDPIAAYLAPPLILDPDPTDYNDPCINDDDPNTGTLDSSLSFRVPGTPGGPPATFYVHVLDWRGDARPDLFYQIQISGAN
jgi:hypothetical protein